MTHVSRCATRKMSVIKQGTAVDCNDKLFVSVQVPDNAQGKSDFCTLGYDFQAVLPSIGYTHCFNVIICVSANSLKPIVYLSIFFMKTPQSTLFRICSPNE